MSTIIKKTLLLILTSILFISSGVSQIEILGSTYYIIETSGSVATDDYTPFWIVSNKYGIAPLEAGNAYLRTGVFHNQILENGFQ